MHILCQYILWVKRKTRSLSSSEPCEEAQELFYQVWLRCAEGSRGAQSKEQLSTPGQKSSTLCSYPSTPLSPHPRAFQPFAPQCQQALLVDVLPLLPLTEAVTSHSPGSVVSCEDEGWAYLCDRDHWWRNRADRGVTSTERGHTPGTQC